MTPNELKQSLEQHERRERFLRNKLTHTRMVAHRDGVVTADEAHEIHGLERRVRDEHDLIARREEQLIGQLIRRGTRFLPNVERIDGNSGGSFITSPAKLVWHTTEGSSIDSAVGAYRAKNAWPHFTLNPKTGRLVQHVPMDVAARALEHRPGTVDTNRAHAIQVELVGSAEHSSEWSDEAYGHIAHLARQIEAAAGVPRKTFVKFTAGGRRLSNSEWLNGTGHCGHQHVPGNSHTDPGALRIDLVV
jgi:hypothetical protein